jgi:hypothetical protein
MDYIVYVTNVVTLKGFYMMTLTTEEVLKMARQARLMSEYDKASPWVEDHEITEYVEAFAKLVADKATAREREACAKVCDVIHMLEVLANPAEKCAKAIRARGGEAT